MLCSCESSPNVCNKMRASARQLVIADACVLSLTNPTAGYNGRKEKRFVSVILCGCLRRQTVKMHSDTDGAVISLLTAFYSMANIKCGAGSRSAADEPTAAMSGRRSAQRLQSAMPYGKSTVWSPPGECEIKCVLIDSKKRSIFPFAFSPVLGYQKRNTVIRPQT